MSQITTHVLDTSRGRPAAGIPVSLQKSAGNEQWKSIASGTTNEDGRVTDLLVKHETLEPGVYRLTFDTGGYFSSQAVKAFYPQVSIEFEITDGSHYHVPLLLSPFGYSTYRGS